MDQFNSKNYSIYANFLNRLALELTKFYYSKLNKTFKVSNKLKGKGYDPVTTSDKAFEKFIRSKIKKKFPDHQVIGEEFGQKKTKSDYTWVIDPIDGTRSFVIGNPTWSNLISLNYKGTPILGLANFPILKKYYINYSDKIAYVVHNGKRKKISVNKKAIFKDVKVSAAFHGWLSLDKQKKIPQILSYETGTNNSPEGLDKGFTHGFVLTFHSGQDRDDYLIHPHHKDFGKLVGPLLEDVFVVDFWNGQ